MAEHEPAGGHNPLSEKKKHELAAGAAVAGLLVFLYLRNKSSSSTSSTTAAAPLVTSPLNASDPYGTGAGGAGGSFPGITGGFGGSGTSSTTSSGSTSSPTPSTPTPTTTPTSPAPAPTPVAATVPSPANPQSYSPGQQVPSSMTGVPAGDVSPGGSTVQTGGFDPTTGWAPGSTITSPSGLETVHVSGGGAVPNTIQQEEFNNLTSQGVPVALAAKETGVKL